MKQALLLISLALSFHKLALSQAEIPLTSNHSAPFTGQVNYSNSTLTSVVIITLAKITNETNIVNSNLTGDSAKVSILSTLTGPISLAVNNSNSCINFPTGSYAGFYIRGTNILS